MPLVHCRDGAEYATDCHKMWSAIMFIDRDTFRFCITVYLFVEAEK